VENWRLAADAVDYGARNDVASVVQHFWSLSVQVQFFAAWPLVVALVALSARGQRDRLHTRLTLTSLGVLIASLSYSVALTDADQPLAYFHSLTRLWEFALGALLALWIDREAVYPAVPPYAQLDDVPSNVSFLDISDAVCDAVRCPAVVGNVLVYLDDNHLTATYATSMSSLLQSRVEDALG
jgi:SGNH domain (fused to AT3 domains)